jgi:hypothetical protein
MILKDYLSLVTLTALMDATKTVKWHHGGASMQAESENTKD